jgi:hypothetical protein
MEKKLLVKIKKSFTDVSQCLSSFCRWFVVDGGGARVGKFAGTLAEIAPWRPRYLFEKHLYLLLRHLPVAVPQVLAEVSIPDSKNR